MFVDQTVENVLIFPTLKNKCVDLAADITIRVVCRVTLVQLCLRKLIFYVKHLSRENVIVVVS